VIVTRARMVDTPRAGDEWPFTMAPVAQVARDGLAFRAPVCFLVGENGSGKSTLVEAIAEAYGADVRGGHIGRRYDNRPDKGALGEVLRLDFAPGAEKQKQRPKGFFLRAETAYNVFEFMSDHGVPRYGGEHLLEISHGESFLQVFRARFNEPGLYLLDEPEAALSFSSCLALMGVLQELAARGGQVICATHSPLLASLPGADVLELSDAGITRVDWSDLALVQHWRDYLADPARYLRHLLS
jgi:predicted ATPase